MCIVNVLVRPARSTRDRAICPSSLCKLSIDTARRSVSAPPWLGRLALPRASSSTSRSREGAASDRDAPVSVLPRPVLHLGHDGKSDVSWWCFRLLSLVAEGVIVVGNVAGATGWTARRGEAPGLVAGRGALFSVVVTRAVCGAAVGFGPCSMATGFVWRCRQRWRAGVAWRLC